MRASLADVIHEVVARETVAQKRGGALVRYGADQADILASAGDEGVTVPMFPVSVSITPSPGHI